MLAHTVISHVENTEAFLSEAIRLAEQGGNIVIHDGDNASMTFDTGSPELDRKMPDVILQAIVANRYVIRQVPRLVQKFAVNITQVIGDTVLEIGSGEYFPVLEKNYSPIAVDSGLAEQAEVDEWLSSIDLALSENVFFGSCNYVTYCLSKGS